MLNFYIPMPKTKEIKVTIPMADKIADLTELYGTPFFENRDGISFEFLLYDNNYETWSNVYSELANAVHGKKVKVILDCDKSYYYMMRLKVSSEKSINGYSKFVLSGTAEPYKRSINTSIDPWLWDLLNFENGIIGGMTFTLADGENKRVIIPSGKYKVTPTIKVIGNPTKLTVNGLNLVIGDNYMAQIQVNGTDTTELLFHYEGAADCDIQIIYRGGSL